jgi:hypothetical protein
MNILIFLFYEKIRDFLIKLSVNYGIVGVSVLVGVTDGVSVGVGVTVGSGVLSIYELPSPYTTISQSVFPLEGALEIFGLNET